MAAPSATATRTAARKHPATAKNEAANARNPKRGTTRKTANQAQPAEQAKQDTPKVTEQAKAKTPKVPTKAELKAAKKAELDKAIALVTDDATKQPGHPLLYVLITNGDFRFHRPDCKSVITDLMKSDYQAPGTMVVESEREAVMDVYDDQIREQFPDTKPEDLTDEQLGSYLAAVEFHGCVKAFASNGNSAKRDAKHALARAMITGMDAAFAALDPQVLEALGGKDAAGAIASAWVHHLPTGEDEDGKRYWPAESLPKPDRSDWR